MQSIFFFRRQRDCFYGDVFVASNTEVDKHIQKVYQGSQHSVSNYSNFPETIGC